MTVEAIKAAIEQLAEPERRKLADWFEQLEEQAWDAETDWLAQRLRQANLCDVAEDQ